MLAVYPRHDRQFVSGLNPAAACECPRLAPILPGFTPLRSHASACIMIQALIRGRHLNHSLKDLEQSRGTHPSADAHGDDGRLGAAPPSLKEDMANLRGTPA